MDAAAAQPLATRDAARNDIRVRVVADVDGDQMEDVALIAVRTPMPPMAIQIGFISHCYLS